MRGERLRREQQRLSRLRALADEGFAQIDQGQGIELQGAQIARFVRALGRAAVRKRRRRPP